MVDVSRYPLKEWAVACLDIADRAGQEIMKVYAQDSFGKSLKDDRTPVTEADLAANRIIVDALSELTPDIVIVSEEEAEKLEGHAVFWLVDPLDGTREFIKRNGEFTVNIALVVDGVSVLGIVTAPAKSVAYVGGLGVVARKRDENRSWSDIRVAENVSDGVIIAGSKSHGSDASNKWIQERFPDARVVGIGSSLKFCLIAEAAAHFYPRFGRTMEWDTAAGHAVLTAAGGRVVLASNEDIDLPYSKAGFENPNFIASYK